MKLNASFYKDYLDNLIYMTYPHNLIYNYNQVTLPDP